MKFLTFKVQKEPGFRFNLTDLIFIILLILLSALIYHFLGTYYLFFLLPLYIGFTFFLFCNIFRVKTKIELIWITLFFISSIISYILFEENWLIGAMLFSSLFQFIQIFLVIKSRREVLD